MTNTDEFSCLLVDDDAGFTSMMAKIVDAEGGKATCSHTIKDATEQAGRRCFDVVILDNGLPDGTGYDFYPRLAKSNPGTVIVMITGAPELSQAVELTRNGLFDYLTKPLDASTFEALLRRVKLRLGRKGPEPGADLLLGSSAKMREVVLQLEQVSRHANATVLLLGETGTGKDVAARYLHRLTFGSDATSKPYVALNCPNVPAEMFEAELFGSEKGAYTGAERRRTGLVEAAQDGTLFLDEVAEIPVGLQPKLLRFLETGEYRSLGGTAVAQFRGRVVAATNRSLPEEVRAGRFREDLMFRLDVFSIRLPPLREHLGDLQAIAAALLDRLCEKYQRQNMAINPEDLNALQGHAFPGNVRELRNLLERSLLRTAEGRHELVMDLEWLRNRSFVVPAPTIELTRSSPATARSLAPLEKQEYDLIARTLATEKGGIRRAAAKLGLTHQALLRRLQKWPELRQSTNSSE